VAELFAGLHVAHMRRIHPEPPGDAQRTLSSLLRILGRPIPPTLERHDMIRLLDSVRDTPESFAVNLAVLRSMSQAEYSPKEIGHFALASKHYSHFTSPIRRYPDLIIHRLLDMFLEGRLRGRGDRQSAPSADALADIGKRCSYTERRAESAERELRQVKLLRFLEKQVGAVEEGIVTDVTQLGLFVQLRRYQVDGLVRFEDLPGDWWEILPKEGCVRGQRSGQRIGIGDVIEVQIAGVDIAARELDLAITTAALEKRPKRQSKREPRPEKKRQTRRAPARSGKKTGGKPRRGRKR
jgi:ribonuclease R